MPLQAQKRADSQTDMITLSTGGTHLATLSTLRDIVDGFICDYTPAQLASLTDYPYLSNINLH